MSDELKCGPCRRGQHGCCDGGLYFQCECCGMATGQATGDDLAEKVAAVLGAHRVNYHHRNVGGDTASGLRYTSCEGCGWLGGWHDEEGWEAHLAAALLPLIREREAAARAPFLQLAEDCERRAAYCACVGTRGQEGLAPGPCCGNTKHTENYHWAARLRAAANPYAGSEGGE